MLAVLISIQPRWCDKIFEFMGYDNRRPLYKKRLELRKTKPKIETPFKCYIYCTKDDSIYHSGEKFYCKKAGEFGNGKIIGEFVCDYVLSHCEMANADMAEQMSCVPREDVLKYSDGKEVFGWHISDLVEYAYPKKLGAFNRLRKTKFGYEPIKLTKAPQSWCYVEEKEGGEQE